MRISDLSVKPVIRVSSVNMEDVQKDCKEWADKIAGQYIPDLIIFIAKSGYLFAEPMAECFGCRMAGITAKRPASNTKDGLKGIIRLVPEKILLRLLSSAFMYKFHEKKQERSIEISAGYRLEKNNAHKKILIVDDSVDTGWTLLLVKKEVEKDFPSAIVKTAGYSVIEYSKQRISVDFHRYENMVILTATSRNSDEYDKFITQYEEWQNGIQNSVQNSGNTPDDKAFDERHR